MIAGWPLHLTILDKMLAAFNTLSIDLFASSIIGRLRIYVSCQSDPDIFIGAFIINCAQFTHSSCVVACFLPTGKEVVVEEKEVVEEKARMLIVVSLYTT